LINERKHLINFFFFLCILKRQESLSVRYIKNIRPSKTSRSIPKAFEIFTDRNSFILKANSSKDAEKWIQFLHLSKAHEISRFTLNESTVYNTSL
jgi:hypothetical protein